MKIENYVIYYHKSILYSIFQNQFLGRNSQIHEKSKKTENTVSVGFFKDRNSTEANMKVQLVNSKKIQIVNMWSKGNYVCLKEKR